PVLDGDVEGMAPDIEVGDDRLPGPVAIAVGHVAPVSPGQQLAIEVLTLWPRLGMRAYPHPLPLVPVPLLDQTRQLGQRADHGVGSVAFGCRAVPVDEHRPGSRPLGPDYVGAVLVTDVDQLPSPATGSGGGGMEDAWVGLAEAGLVRRQPELEVLADRGSRPPGGSTRDHAQHQLVG